MKAKANKLLSLILALAMCLSMVQGIAFAVESATVKEVKIAENGDVTVTWSDGKETKPGKATQKEKKDATCGEDGYIIWTTTQSGTTKEEKYPLTDRPSHTPGTPETIVDEAATCEKGGKTHTETKCTVCQKVLERGNETTTGALNHDWETTYEDLVNVTVDKDGKATLKDKTKDGSYTIVKTCKNDKTHVERENKTVNKTVQSAEQGKTVPEYINGSEKDNVVINEGKVTLKDCNKPGKYNEVTYDTDNKTVLKKEEKTVPAGHTPAKLTQDDVQKAKTSSKNIVVSLNNKGEMVGTNNSCKEDGWFEYDVNCAVCGKKIETKRVTVAKSTKHTPSAQAKYENDTATCQKEGTKDEVIYCAVCGAEMSRKSVKSDKKPHEGKDPVIENQKAPTAHNEGSYDSVVYCKWGGEEMKRTTVKVPATKKDKYNWSFEIQWSKEYAFVGNEDDGYISSNTKPTASLVAKPTDSDLNADQIKALTKTVVDELEVTEDTAKATKGDACHFSTKTFTTKVDKKYMATEVLEPAESNDTKATEVKMESTQAYNVKQDGYKGHKWGVPVRRVTKKATATETGEALWEQTCPVCNEIKVERKEIIPATSKKDEEKKDEEKKEETPAPAPAPVKAKIDISKAVIKGSAAYTGKAFEVPFTVTLNGKKLTEGKDFKLTNGKENTFVGVGKHKVVAEGLGDYTGSAVGYLTITATKQKIKVTPTKKTLKAKALKKKAASFSVKVSGAKGKVTLKSKSKKVTVKGKKITVKKGTKKGTYKVTVNVAKKGGFKAAKKTITIKVK